MPAAGRRDKRGQRGCADSQRTSQMFLFAAGTFATILVVALVAWWQGWVELDDGAPAPADQIRDAGKPGAEARPVRGRPASDAPVAGRQPPSQILGPASRDAAPPPPLDQQVLRRVFLAANGGTINTGVWPAWGGKTDSTAQLQWAAAGVEVVKRCPYRCEFFQGDPRSPADADAIVVETVNHPKFGHDGKPMPWPKPVKGPGKPLVGGFYMEPAGHYERFQAGHPDFDDHVDFSVAYERSSTVPVSLMCPWGVAPASDAATRVFGELAAPYLNPVSAATRGERDGVAFFSDRGVDSAVWPRLKSLADLAGARLHAYRAPNGFRQQPLPDDAQGALETLPARLKLLGRYRVVIVAQSSTTAGWMEPELSHALVAGAVPVVWGPSDLADLMPAPDSFIDAAGFGDNVKGLWDAVRRVMTVDSEYDRRQEWRAAVVADAEKAATAAAAAGPAARARDFLPAGGRGGTFLKFADEVAGACVHYAECRICEWVHRSLD